MSLRLMIAPIPTDEAPVIKTGVILEEKEQRIATEDRK